MSASHNQRTIAKPPVAAPGAGMHILEIDEQRVPTHVELRSRVPVMPVVDVDEAIAFYRDLLGFVLEFEVDRYAGVTRDGVLLHVHST